MSHDKHWLGCRNWFRGCIIVCATNEVIESNLNFEEDSNKKGKTMVLIGMLGGLILCGFVIAKVKSIRNSGKTADVTKLF